MWDHLFFLLHSWECKWSPLSSVVAKGEICNLSSLSSFLKWISTRVTKGLKHLKARGWWSDTWGPEWSGVASSSSALQPLGHSADQLIMFQFTSFWLEYYRFDFCCLNQRCLIKGIPSISIYRSSFNFWEMYISMFISIYYPYLTIP